MERYLIATVSTKRHTYPVIVEKTYKGYRVIDCDLNPQFLIDRRYTYGHGLYNRKKITEDRLHNLYQAALDREDLCWWDM